MIAEITIALVKEIEKLYELENISILYLNRKTNKLPSFNIPVIFISRIGSPDITQLTGGAINESWDFSISIYDYEPNEELQPDDDYSFSLLDCINKIVEHFAIGQWLTNEFQSIYDNYSFRMTMQSGISEAADLEVDENLLIGYEVTYSTIAFSMNTTSVLQSENSLLWTFGEVIFNGQVGESWSGS